MSWQQHSPKPSSSLSERKTNFLNKNGGKSSSFNSALSSSSKTTGSNPLSHSGGHPRIPLHLQNKLSPKNDGRKRGITVATTSNDSVESRRKDLLGLSDDGEDSEPLERERSKSYEVLPTWDFTPFTVKLKQESSVDQYIKDEDEDEEEEELRGSQLYKTSPIIGLQGSPNSSNPGSPIQSSSSSSSTPPPLPPPRNSNNSLLTTSSGGSTGSPGSAASPLTLSASFSIELPSQSPESSSSIRDSILSTSVNSILSPLTSSLSLSSGELIPNPNRTASLSSSSNGLFEFTLTQTVQSQKLNYEKHPDDSSKFIVISGPKQELLDNLFLKSKIDPNFVNTFILTFRYYVTVNEFFEFLISNFYIKAPTTLSNKVSKQYDEIITSIKQNVIIIFSNWIDSNFSDFLDDKELYDRLIDFINDVSSKVLRDAVDRQSITKFNILELYEKMKSELLPIIAIQNGSSSSNSLSSSGSSKPTSLTSSIGRNSSQSLNSEKNSVFISGQQIIDWISKNCDIGSSTAETIFRKFIKVKVIASVGGFVSFSGKVHKELFFFVNVEIPILKTVHSKQFLDYNPQDLAKQLTIMEFKIFQQIKMKEIYYKSWTHTKTKHINSPTIMRLIQMSNKIANWVATEVVTTPHPKKRVEVLKRMISLAEYCKKFNNYNTLMEVVSGLNNSSVVRLKDTWKNLPSRYNNSLHQLQNFLNTNENWKYYRQALKSHDVPCLPYMGLFLQDINFVEDGNQNTINYNVNTNSLVKSGGFNPDNSNEDGIEQHINFKKMGLLSNIFSEIQFYQKHPYYTFTNHPHIQVFLENDIIILPEKELYDFSKFIESPTNPLNKLNKYIV